MFEICARKATMAAACFLLLLAFGAVAPSGAAYANGLAQGVPLGVESDGAVDIAALPRSWVGEYDGSDGGITVRRSLEVEIASIDAATGSVEGTASFSASEKADPEYAATGSYRFSGEIDPGTGKLWIQGHTWIDYPEDYDNFDFVMLDGTVTARAILGRSENGIWSMTAVGEGGGETSVGLRRYPDYAGFYEPGFDGYKRLLGKYGESVVRSVDGRFSSMSVGELAGRFPALDDFASIATYPVPGLEATRLSGDEWCQSMVPQGVCTTDDYILVSAYCAEQDLLWDLDGKNPEGVGGVGGNGRLLEELEEGRDSTCGGGGAHECVLQVLDKSTGMYLKTLALEGVGSECHAGGLACVGGSVWVALSGQHKSGDDVAVLKLEESAVERAVNATSEGYARVSGEIVNCPESGAIEAASFLSSSEGRLWVGYFNKGSDGQLLGYEVSGGSLVHDRTYTIPKKANGAAFFEYDGDGYILVNQSYGRNNDSRSLLFEVDIASEDDVKFGLGKGCRRPVRQFVLPPMLEEACVDGGRLYTVYESGATRYSCLDGPNGSSPYEKRCQAIVDYVCVGDVGDVVWPGTFWPLRLLLNALLVACPVDLEVYDENGLLVCRTSGDEVEELDSESGLEAEVLDGGRKLIGLPRDGSYRVVATPTAAGAMDVSYSERDFMGLTAFRTGFDNLELAQGKPYTIHVKSASDMGDDGSGEPLNDGGDLAGLQGLRIEVTSPQGQGVAPTATGTGWDLSKAEAVLDEGFHSYDGERFAPTLASVTLGGVKLFEGVDYEYEYVDSEGYAIDAPWEEGSYFVKVAARDGGALEGELLVPFRIAQGYEMHRLYNRWTGEHFYTADEGERDHLVEVGWTYEGIGWNAPESSSTPVYRLYNKYVPGGDHHYTTDASEKNKLVDVGWIYEGVGWYSDDAKGTPLYRQYNPFAETGTHNYTADKDENDKLVSLGWRAEGVGWYGV